MRVINSGWELAKERKEKLLILWNCNKELNCPFDSIFRPIKEFRIINIYSVLDPRKLYYQKTAKTYLNNEEIISHRNKAGQLDADFVNNIRSNCYIFTWEHFYPARDYHLFIPTESLQKRIDQMTADFDSFCVGVHIRRTDNKPAIGKSSTQAFIRAMQQELLQNPDTKFYLATDDKKEEETLRKVFPGKILSNEKRCLRRDSAEGIYDALLDLYCLASTNKIIGSYFSSFTDIAADMHKIPKIIAGENN